MLANNNNYNNKLVLKKIKIINLFTMGDENLYTNYFFNYIPNLFKEYIWNIL